MDTTESLGYLKGLLDGMDLDESKKETKIYRAMIGVLENLAEDVNDLTDGVEMMADQLDAVDEDLGDVEEYLYGDEDDDDCDCDCCDAFLHWCLSIRLRTCSRTTNGAMLPLRHTRSIFLGRLYGVPRLRRDPGV